MIYLALFLGSFRFSSELEGIHNEVFQFLHQPLAATDSTINVKQLALDSILNLDFVVQF